MGGVPAAQTSMATDIEIGGRLASAREARKLTREQLAERLGVSLATVQHHENGFRGIRRTAAEQYARSLRISVEWLFTGQGEMTGTSDPVTAEVVQIMPKLDEARRKQLADYARFLAAQKTSK